MTPATKPQLDYLKSLIKQVEPDMVIPANCTLQQAQSRIGWLIKKKNDPKIIQKKFMK